MNTNGIFVADQNDSARSTLFLQPQARTCDARWTASFLTLLPCSNPCSLHICQTLSPSAQLVREVYMAFEKARDYDMLSLATIKPSEDFSGGLEASPTLFCYAGGCLAIALETLFQYKLLGKHVGYT